MAKYKITIHEHNIYDYMVEASDKNEAIDMAENSIVGDEKHLWTPDEMAGWTEIGSVYNESGKKCKLLPNHKYDIIKSEGG
jgi:hypothetical protein